MNASAIRGMAHFNMYNVYRIEKTAFYNANVFKAF